MNFIWEILIFISIVFGVLTNHTEEMVNAILSTPSDTLKLLFKIGGLIIFYNGLFKVAIDSGVIKSLSKLFYKPIRKLFNTFPSNHIVYEYISANIVSNLLGLGIASTPMAIKALEEMKKLNNNKNNLTKPMIIFLVINIASFTIFPLTIISIRDVYFAKVNINLLPFIIIVTFLNTLISVLITKVILRIKKYE